MEHFSPDPAVWLDAHGLSTVDARKYVTWFRTAYDTIKDFVDYNKTLIPTFNNNLAAPTTTTPNQVDVNGTFTRTTRLWRSAAFNPEVYLVWDNVMGHTDAGNSINSINETDVFAFFKAHPRL